MVHQAHFTAETEKELEKANTQLQEQRQKLESLQSQQAEDVRGISKQQKNTERYLAKRQMLLNRKDDCNRNIRDLGVLPEEAFEKYTNEKVDRVCSYLTGHSTEQSFLRCPLFAARQEVAQRQRRPQEVRPREQESV